MRTSDNVGDRFNRHAHSDIISVSSGPRQCKERANMDGRSTEEVRRSKSR